MALHRDRSFVLSPRIGATLALSLLTANTSMRAQSTRPSTQRLAPVSMVPVPAGTFIMGNTGAARGERYEFPQRSVHIAAFSMSRTEVTQSDFASVMGYNSSQNPGASRPVEGVSWFDAVRFCNALSVRDGFDPAYRVDPFLGYTVDRSANGYRLPTEAEWEYAAKAGTTTDTYAGNLAAHQGRDAALDDIAWYRSAESVDDTAHTVAKKQPNAFGFYDMLGNVFEWTDAPFAAYPGGQMPPETPGAAEAAALKVLRGGAIDTAAEYSRAAYRYQLHPSYTSYNIGFRVVRSDRR